MINVDLNSCGVCKYATMDYQSKALIKVYCDLREKTYIYGMCIQCDGPTKEKNND